MLQELGRLVLQILSVKTTDYETVKKPVQSETRRSVDHQITQKHHRRQTQQPDHQVPVRTSTDLDPELETSLEARIWNFTNTLTNVRENRKCNVNSTSHRLYIKYYTSFCNLATEKWKWNPEWRCLQFNVTHKSTFQSSVSSFFLSFQSHHFTPNFIVLSQNFNIFTSKFHSFYPTFWWFLVETTKYRQKLHYIG